MALCCSCCISRGGSFCCGKCLCSGSLTPVGSLQRLCSSSLGLADKEKDKGGVNG